MKANTNNDPPQVVWSILAVMRLCLASVVMVGHMAFFYAIPVGTLRFLSSLNGSYAVLWFLAISGFSIAHSHTKNPDGYYARRCWRILPVYGACVAVALVPYLFSFDISQAYGGSTVTHAKFWSTLLAAFTFSLSGHVDTDGPIWSLGVEVLWYALTPLLARSRIIIVTLMVGSFAMFHWTGWPSTTWSIGGNATLSAIPMVSWAWLAGFCLYHACKRWPTFSFSGRVAKTAQWCGDISYPVYLVHMPVLWLLNAIGFPMSAYTALIFVIVSSATVFHLVDLPSRRLRKVMGSRHSKKSDQTGLHASLACKPAGKASLVNAKLESEPRKT